MLTVWFGVLVALNIIKADAVVIRADRSDADALARGAVYESVGQIGQPGSWWGSSVLIEEEWLLTAGHNLYDGLGQIENEIWVKLAGETLQADSWFAHENYDDTGDWQDWDIG